MAPSARHEPRGRSERARIAGMSSRPNPRTRLTSRADPRHRRNLRALRLEDYVTGHRRRSHRRARAQLPRVATAVMGREPRKPPGETPKAATEPQPWTRSKSRCQCKGTSRREH